MRRGVLAAILLSMALGACGGERREGSAEGRPVTDAEAARMAETLFNNHELGTAGFVLNASLPDATTVRMIGTIDWNAGTGRAAVTTSGGPEAAVTELAWGPNTVLERIPALTQLAAQTGQPPIDWVARPADTSGRQLDALIAVVAGLATERPDNAVLIAQQPGTRWLRSDARDGIEVDVLRYGERSVFWLATGAVTLVRFEGNNTPGNRPVVVDLSDHGRAVIELPAASAVTEALRVIDLYQAATGGLTVTNS